MNTTDFVTHLGQAKASAILRTQRTQAAHAAMEAALRGGFTVIEFTYSIPGALELIQEFARRPGIVVGAGTVLTLEDAEQAVDAGARYLVSPVVDEVVIHAAARLGVAAMPGCSTPTEMLRAHRAGAPLQKLFPGAGTGPAFVQQCLGPLSFLKLVPTSGVTPENATDYLRAGAFALGFVNSLFEPEDIASEAYDVIEHRSRHILETLHSFQPS